MRGEVRRIRPMDTGKDLCTPKPISRSGAKPSPLGVINFLREPLGGGTEEIMAKRRHFTDLKCKSTVYLTPSTILDPVRGYFGGQIPLDPATEWNNPTGAAAYGTKPEECNGLAAIGDYMGDGLKIDWFEQGGVFVNPPYGKELRLWCEKIWEEAQNGATIIALLPAGPRFATRYFQENILTPALDAVTFVKGRVKFLRPDGSPTTGQNPYDSCIYGYNVDIERFRECLGHLGATFETKLLS